MRGVSSFLVVVVLLGGCNRLSSTAPDIRDDVVIRPQSRPAVIAPAPATGATTAAAFDTTSEADKAAALAPTPAPSGERSLGKTAVALGNPADPGFWLRSVLVKVSGKGRVEVAGGASIAVDLIPGEGAAQLSLPAFRALNLPLTALPEVTIYAR